MNYNTSKLNTKSILKLLNIPETDSKDVIIEKLCKATVQLLQKSSDDDSQKAALKDYVEKLVKTLVSVKGILESLMATAYDRIGSKDPETLFLFINPIEQALRQVNDILGYHHRHTRPDSRDKNVPKGTVRPKSPKQSKEEAAKSAYEHVVDGVKDLERGLEGGDLDEEAAEPILQTILDYSKEMFDEAKRRRSRELRRSDKTGHVSSGKLTKYEVLNRNRKPSGNRPGGVKGHAGHTIGISAEEADEVVKLYPEGYGPDDPGLVEGTRRFVVDEVSYAKVTEYVQMVAVKKDGNGKTVKVKGKFPDGVKAYVQYGPDLQADVASLKLFGMSINQISEYYKEKYSIPISAATVSSIIQRAGGKVEEPVEAIRTKLKNEPVVHFDETPVSLKGKDAYVHTAASGSFTLLTRGRNRGKDGADDLGVAKGMKGVAVSDRFSLYTGSYFDHVRQAFCHSHGTRDLEFLHALFPNLLFPRRMLNCFRQMHKLAEGAREEGKDEVGKRAEEAMMEEYWQTIKLGEEEAKSLDKDNEVDRKFLSLLKSLKERWMEWTRFFTDLSVPYTNNLAESALRPLKQSVKVTGSYRSESGLDAELALRSYTQTAKKQGLNPITALQQAVKGNGMYVLTHVPLKEPEKSKPKVVTVASGKPAA